MSKCSILLLKDNDLPSKNETSSSSADYETILSELGCRICFIPPLQFDFINIDSIVSKIFNPEKYSGIVLTSPRSVVSFCQAFKRIEKEQDLNIWRENKICYTVGPSTALRASQDLRWSPSNIRGGDECGNAHSLAELIIKDSKKKDLELKRLLYPCGNLKRETLAEELSKQSNIQLDPITCYETSPNKDLDSNFDKLSKHSFRIDIVVFFSPSGVKSCWERLHKDITNPLRYIAIGPTTFESLKSYCSDDGRIFQSKSPNPSGIRDVVSQIIENL